MAAGGCGPGRGQGPGKTKTSLEKIYWEACQGGAGLFLWGEGGRVPPSGSVSRPASFAWGAGGGCGFKAGPGPTCALRGAGLFVNPMSPFSNSLGFTPGFERARAVGCWGALIGPPRPKTFFVFFPVARKKRSWGAQKGGMGGGGPCRNNGGAPLGGWGLFFSVWWGGGTPGKAHT